MLRKFCVGLVLLAALPLWSQVEPSASGGEISLDDSRMMMPPPVSGVAYPSVGRSQERSNYLSGGVTFTGAYVDNVFAGELATPVSAEIYTVLPSISLEQTTARQHADIAYGAGFTFYEPVSQLNEVDQNAHAGYEYRVSPRTSISVDDAFVQTSNAFATTGAISPGTSGLVDVVTPFGNRYMNDAGGAVTYQFGLNGMVGGGVESDVLNYPNESQVPGLLNSNAITGSGFYSRRISPNHYVGAIFLYSHITTSPMDSTVDTYSPSLFYTLYFKRNVSLSVEAGAEHYEDSGTGLQPEHAWTPNVRASGGWQGNRSAVSAHYSRMVSGGGGLLGSYKATAAGASLSWRANSRWGTGVSADYAENSTQASVLYPSGEGGHSVVGTASIGREIQQHLQFSLGYSWIHEKYSGVAALAADPDSNRGFVSITYRFEKPIGR